MAGTAANILVGAPSLFKIGAYVTSKGAATLSDVGFTMGGVTIDPKTELHLVKVDQKLGTLAALPKDREYDLKVKLSEASMENLRIALAQPSANLTGTAPNQTLLLDGSAVEQYYQLQFVGPGLGTNKSRTVTCWKAAVKEMGGWPFKKDSAQDLDLTFLLCEETTGSGADSILKAVET